MRSRDTDVVFIPGLGGSGPDHWQSRWQARLPNATRVEQADWEMANRAAWVERIVHTIAQCERPVVAVAHSIGVVALAWALREGVAPIAGAFLVTPPSNATMRELPAIDPAFAPAPMQRLEVPTLLVASRNDPYASFGEVAALAEPWGARLIDGGDAGHVNTESGHGPWPEGLMVFAGFLNKL